ncbi:MAG: hypothetical protein DVB25_04285 [Verrucomicrobia bacterium]|nr:MAG: hypothetical protein DVB25_04285 [Verrucomicrobiota bacterium]
MTEPNTIVCKPTRWFLFRAFVMVLMFGVFAVLFYIDGSSGYRSKNEVFYLKRAFQTANQKFTDKNHGGALTPEAWKRYAAAQTVDFPADRSVLPTRLSVPMPWPEVLQDYERMQTQWNLLWREYTKTRGINEAVPEEAYDARKIKEQWVVFSICATLTLSIGYILLRTMRRCIVADAEAITDQRGRRIPYADMKFLDLRKWDTKGLAFVAYAGSSGNGRIRLDGLTYGGFSKEEGEPAEKLMERLCSNFTGEVMEYAVVGSSGSAHASKAAAADSETGPKPG